MATIPNKPSKSWVESLGSNIKSKYDKQGGSYAKETYHPDGTVTYDDGSKSSSGGGSGGSSSGGRSSSGGYSYSPYKAPSYKPISYSQAQSRAQGQIDPVYQRALENVRQSIQPSKLNADQLAASRGGLHSGLAADLQNKVQINADSKMSDMESDRASKISQLAQAMVNQDFSQQNAIQQQAFQNWLSQQNFDYGIYRDQMGDQRWNDEFAFNKKLQEALTTGRWYF